MKEYAVLAESKLGEWTVVGVYENEEEAEKAVCRAWCEVDHWGYDIYHAVQIFERWAA